MPERNGEAILQYRKQLNCTQAQLANVLGVSEHTIYLWEHNKSGPGQPVLRLLRLLVALKLVGIVLNEMNIPRR